MTRINKRTTDSKGNLIGEKNAPTPAEKSASEHKENSNSTLNKAASTQEGGSFYTAVAGALGVLGITGLSFQKIKIVTDVFKVILSIPQTIKLISPYLSLKALKKSSSSTTDDTSNIAPEENKDHIKEVANTAKEKSIVLSVEVSADLQKLAAVVTMGDGCMAAPITVPLMTSSAASQLQINSEEHALSQELVNTGEQGNIIHNKIEVIGNYSAEYDKQDSE